MNPYIEVGNDTRKLELGKWNGKDTKVDFFTALEDLDADKLELSYDFVKSIAS